MLFNPKHDDLLARLEERLRRADAVTSELMSDVMAVACPRIGAFKSATQASVDRLIENGAWTDAALALLEAELPQWTLRRLVYEDGEWLCALSGQPGLPFEFDEVAEAGHEILPLAILMAFLQARRLPPASATRAAAVPVRSASVYAVYCDDFA